VIAVGVKGVIVGGELLKVGGEAIALFGVTVGAIALGNVTEGFTLLL